MIKAIFSKLCPNCGGDISVERLEKGLPCERCMPKEGDPCKRLKKGTLWEVCQGGKRTLRMGGGVQKGCICRNLGICKGHGQRGCLWDIPLGLLAPTGVGKTSFGLSMVSFLTKKNKKSYVILPTKLLVEQTVRKLKSFGLDEKHILYFGDDTEKEKREKRKRLEDGNFLVLVSTSMFLYKNYESLPKDFAFIFVDDVDSFLKTC
jgi:reverse gyrase